MATKNKKDNNDLEDEDLLKTGESEEEDREDDDDLEDEDEELGSLAEKHKKLIDKLVSEKVASAKKAIEKAYSRAEKAEQESAKLRKQVEAASRKKLEEEGKLLEAKDSELNELRATNKDLEDRLLAFTRDQNIEKVLNSLEVEFKNNFSKDIAVKEIRAQLIKDDDGEWVHKSGATLKDFIRTFIKSPETIDTLLKNKENSGTGGSNQGKGGSKKPDNLKDLSSAQLLELARKGAFGDFSF